MKIRLKMFLCDVDKSMVHLADHIANWSLNKYENTGCEVYRRLGLVSVKMAVFYFNRQVRRGQEILTWFDSHGKKAQA